MRHFLISIFIILFCVPLNAQTFSGSWGYKIDGKLVTLYGDKISNHNYSGSTGTLKIALYASYYPYSGGSISGYNLFETTLEPLSGGYYYSDISKTGYCSYPPSGGYYLTILLLEYNYSYEIVDYISLDGYQLF